MVFSTHLFIFYFLPLVLLLNYTLPFRYLTLMLGIMSYAFYGWANPPWILLMLFSSLVDYFCGLALVKFSGLPMNGPDLPWLPPGQPRNGKQKAALAISMTSNLCLLGFFKYHDFGLENINALCTALGLGPATGHMLHVALPVGISFYTFQSMSYAIDVYRGEARPLRNPIDFQYFVAAFPHLVAGPIIRYQTVAEQIRKRTFTWEKFARGVSFFSLGMGKKILLANPMGHVADAAFAAGHGNLHCADAWYGLGAYAFQIYFDFSAYSDMAVGLGLMIGFCFTKNFDSPYRAESITDFWRRWHMSLSTWLRDYLYVPLGGNRKGPARTYINLMLVMLLGGLWHGAQWTFVAWGGIHGLMLAQERLQGKDSPWRKLPHALRVAVTFMVVCLGWVFCAETFTRAWEYLGALIGRGGATGGGGAADGVGAVVRTPYHLAMFALCAVLVWTAPQVWTFTQKLTPAKAVACLVVLLVSIALMWTQTVNPFLYFQF